METVLLTDHGTVVFAILTSALALLFSVMGLATSIRRAPRLSITLESLAIPDGTP
jgi:hypothetical protein